MISISGGMVELKFGFFSHNATNAISSVLHLKRLPIAYQFNTDYNAKCYQLLRVTNSRGQDSDMYMEYANAMYNCSPVLRTTVLALTYNCISIDVQPY